MRINVNKKSIIWIAIAALVILAITLGLVFSLQGGNKDAKIVGAVVSNGRGCADIGRETLYDGGSTADAAIATLLCESVLLPHSMGPGGGFIATIYTKATGKIETLNAREAAPLAAHKDMFVGTGAVTGAKAVAVPGELIGYWELHQKYGLLPWEKLFEPTIKLCKEGHWVSRYLAAALKSKEQEVRNQPTLAEVFVKSDGSLYKEGDYLKRTKLGETYEKIAKNGIGVMYDGGEVGQMLVEDLKEMGGIIEVDDLKKYRPRWESSHHVTANVTGGYTLYTTPLPSSGVLLTFILNVLSDIFTTERNTYWQRVVESFKHAYGQRSNLGDMEKDEAMRENITETLNKLISQDFAKHVRTLISDNSTHNDFAYYGANFTIEEDHGTANMAVLAANGDAITITSTINTYFGAKVRSSRTGIIFNDEMDDFSTPGKLNMFGVPPSPANYIQPGKIPMSSMCPAIILDRNGNVRMLVGAAGGTKITTAVAIAIIKYLILNENIEESVNSGRFHHQLAPMEVEVEPQLPESLREHFEKIGHKIEFSTESTGFAAVTAIGVKNNIPEPWYDRRRIGSTATVQARNKMNHRQG